MDTRLSSTGNCAGRTCRQEPAGARFDLPDALFVVFQRLVKHVQYREVSSFKKIEFFKEKLKKGIDKAFFLC